MTLNPKLIIAGALACAGVASAQVPWAQPNGAGSFFTYSAGHNSNTNLFGSAVTLVGDSFQIFPSNFIAQSLGGQAAGATDQLNVILTANPGHRFTQIGLQEFGTWAITGVGTVQDSGTLFLQDLIIPNHIAMQNIQTNPVMPITTPGSGFWNGQTLIDLDALGGPNWTQLMLVFTNTLQAGTTGTGSAATITKKIVQGPSVVVTIFPTPGSGAVLAAGCVLLARRRRR